MFTLQGPDGQSYHIDAPDEASASAALGEMLSGGGGQNAMQGGNEDNPFMSLPTREEKRATAGGGQMQQPGGNNPFMDAPASPQTQFRDAFDPSQDRPETAQALDQRVNGEADNRGRWATAGNALTMGFGDEFMGALAGGLTWVQGKGFDEGYNKMTGAIRGDIANYSERHPVESTAIDIAGSLPTAMVPGGAAVRGAGLATKVGRGAVAGATYGGIRGFGEGEGGLEPRMKGLKEGAAMGGAVGGAVPVVGNMVGKAVGKRLGRNMAPTVEDIGDKASALYQRADSAGVAVQPRALQRLTTVMPQRMANMGFDPVLHPNTSRAMQVIEQRAAQGMQPSQSGAHTVFSLGEVENMRRIIREAITASSGPNGKADRQKAQALLEQFDGWMNGLQPKDMLAAGPISGREAIQIMQEARGLWAQKTKGDILADIVENAKLEDDFERGLRTGFKALAKRINKKQVGGFSKAEADAIKKVARGGDMGWVTRAIGSFSPTSVAGAIRSGVVAGLAGAASGNPLPAVLPIVGYGAKKVGDRATRLAADNASATVRSGGSMPVSPKGKVVGDYVTGILGTGGQAAAPQVIPSR